MLGKHLTGLLHCCLRYKLISVASNSLTPPFIITVNNIPDVSVFNIRWHGYMDMLGNLLYNNGFQNDSAGDRRYLRLPTAPSLTVLDGHG